MSFRNVRQGWIGGATGPTVVKLSVPASLTLTPTTTKKIRKPVAAGLTLTAAQTKHLGRRLIVAASMTLTAAMQKSRKWLLTENASLVLSGGKIGYETIGAHAQTAGSGFISVTKFSVPGPGHHFPYVESYHGGDGTVGNANLRAVVYSDNGGVPDELIAVGNEMSVDTGDTSGRLVQYDLPNPFLSGDVWVGWWLGTNTNHLLFFYDLGPTGSENYTAVPYSSASDPPSVFPSPSATSSEYTMDMPIPIMDEYPLVKRSFALSLSATPALVTKKIARKVILVGLTLTATMSKSVVNKVRPVLVMVLTATNSLKSIYRVAMPVSLVDSVVMSKFINAYRTFAATFSTTLTMDEFRLKHRSLAAALSSALGISPAFRHTEIAASNLTVTPATTKGISNLVEAEIGIDTDILFGGAHHISFARALNFAMSLVKKAKLRNSVVLQTNPRVDFKSKRFIALARTLSLTGAMPRFVSRFRVFNTVLSLTVAMAKPSLRHITRATALVVSPGIRVKGKIKKSVAANLVFNVAMKRRINHCFHTVLHLTSSLKTLPARFAALGVDGLLSAKTASSRLLSAISLRQS